MIGIWIAIWLSINDPCVFGEVITTNPPVWDCTTKGGYYRHLHFEDSKEVDGERP